MNTQSEKNPAVPANIVWFEVPADDPQRARNFYGELFGWKSDLMPGAEAMQYYHLDTGGADASPDGGLMKRQNPGQRGITNYIAVASVNESVAKVQKLGGTVCMPKTPVPGMGFFAICQDTEGNTFGVWEREETAK